MDKDYKGKSVVESGISIISGTAGSVVGTLLDPGAGTIVGAIAGSTIGEFVSKGLADFAHRALSTRELLRVKSTATYAIDKINQRLVSGDTPRADGFFDTDKTDRSDADEIFEGVLLKAKNEYQEKKLKYLANFIANVAFRPDVSASVANFLLKTADELSYQQFCFIALVKREVVLNAQVIRDRNHTDHDLNVLAQEEMYLHRKTSFGGCGLLAGKGNWHDTLSDVGELFFDVLGLNEIPEDDLVALQRLIDLGNKSPVSKIPVTKSL